MPLMHLQAKKRQNGRIKVFRNKQATTNVSPIFFKYQNAQRIASILFLTGCKPKRKVQRMYLGFKNLKIKHKQGNKSNKKQETSKTVPFGD